MKCMTRFFFLVVVRDVSNEKNQCFLSSQQQTNTFRLLFAASEWVAFLLTLRENPRNMGWNIRAQTHATVIHELFKFQVYSSFYEETIINNNKWERIGFFCNFFYLSCTIPWHGSMTAGEGGDKGTFESIMIVRSQGSRRHIEKVRVSDASFLSTSRLERMMSFNGSSCFYHPLRDSKTWSYLLSFGFQSSLKKKRW